MHRMSFRFSMFDYADEELSAGYREFVCGIRFNLMRILLIVIEVHKAVHFDRSFALSCFIGSCGLGSKVSTFTSTI